MAQNAGTINVTLSANTVAFNTGMSKAAQAAKDAGREIRGAFDKLGDVASVALAPFGELGVVMGNAFKGLGDLAPGILKSFGGISEAAAGFISVSAGIAGAAAAIGAAMGEMAVQGADAIERLLIVSQKTGLAIRDLQVFEAAGMTVDVSLEDMVTAMRKFDQALTGTSKQAALAKVVLAELGVTATTPKEALLQVADAFSHMQDGATKGAEAVALFGKSGLTLIPLLNKGRAGIEEMEAAVAKYGHTITGEEIVATENWKKATTDLSIAWTGFKENMVASVLPTFSKLAEFIADAVRNMGNLAESLAFVAAAIVNPLSAIQSLGARPTKATAAAGPTGPNFFPIEGLDLFKRQWKELDETMADGGRAAHALAVQKEKIQGAELANNHQLAIELRTQLPLLEAAVAAEKEAAREAERRALAHQHMVDAMLRQSAGLKTGPGAEIGPQWKPGFFEGRTAAAAQPAPDIQIGDDQLAAIGASIKHVIAGNVQEGTEIGQEALAAFYKHWDEENKKSTAVINESYQKQLTEFQGFLALGEISQKQFADVSVALEQERVLKILKARQEEIRTWDEEALKFGSFQDKFHALLNEVALDGENFGQKVFESFHKAIDGLSDQLAHFVVTGKANFKQLLTSMEESIAKAGFQQLFGKVSSVIADKLGLPNILGAGKPDGTIGNPLHVMIVAGPGGLFGGAGGGGLGGLFGGGQNSESGGGGGLFSGGGGGGGGGILGFLGSLFGGGGGAAAGASDTSSIFGDLLMGAAGLANGGDVTPGKAYVVGEKHPEFFVPRQPGHVSPSLQTGTHIINMGGIHIHGVQDADSFSKSKAQIYAELRSEMDRTLYRNSR